MVKQLFNHLDPSGLRYIKAKDLQFLETLDLQPVLERLELELDGLRAKMSHQACRNLQVLTKIFFLAKSQNVS